MTPRSIVVVLPDNPLPATTGYHHRMLSDLAVCRALGWRTIALWFDTADDRAAPDALAEHADEVVAAGARVEHFGVPARLVQRAAWLGGAMRRRPSSSYPWSARYDVVGGAATVAAVADRFDADAVLLPTMLAHWSTTVRRDGRLLVGDAVDVLSQLGARHLATVPWTAPHRRAALGINQLANRAQERLFLPTFAELWATTPGEGAALRAIAPAANVVVVGNALDGTTLQATSLPANDDIGFIGTYSWPANLAAARFLGDRVAADLHARRPRARIRLAGAGLPAADAARLASHPNVEVLGHVEDAAAMVSSCRIIALPITVRGGLPLKLVEALALGRPVVATPELVDGTPLVAGRELAVATADASFADALVALLDDAVAAEAMGAAGRRAFDEHLSIDAAIRVASASSMLSA